MTINEASDSFTMQQTVYDFMLVRHYVSVLHSF